MADDSEKTIELARVESSAYCFHYDSDSARLMQNIKYMHKARVQWKGNSQWPLGITTRGTRKS